MINNGVDALKAKVTGMMDGIEKTDITIDGVVVSEEIFTKYFKCNLKRCKGVCCARKEDVYIDLGVTLQENEIKIIEDMVSEIAHYLPKESLEKIRKDGVIGTNEYGQPMVQLVNYDGLNKCVFTIKENGCYLCAIEKAFREGNPRLIELNFLKPISCHLYPIMCIDDGLVYEKDDDCRAVKDFKIPLYIAQKEPLIRRFGEEWYRKLIDNQA